LAYIRWYLSRACFVIAWTLNGGGEDQDDRAQVVEVAGQPVHGVHDHGVAVTDEAEQRFQLWPFGVLARGAVGEGLVELDAVELPVEVLVQAADPGIADPLTGDRGLLASVRMKPKSLTGRCQSMPIRALTGRRAGSSSDVGLGCTPC